MFVKQVYRSANTSRRRTLHRHYGQLSSVHLQNTKDIILEHVFNSNNYNNNNNNNFFAHWYFIPRDLEISKV